MAAHSSILAWRIPWTEKQATWGCKESDTTEQLTHTPTLFTSHHSRSPHSTPLVVSFYFDSLKKKKKVSCITVAPLLPGASSRALHKVGSLSVRLQLTLRTMLLSGTQWKLTKSLVNRFLRLSQTTPNLSIWTQSHPLVLAAISKWLLNIQTSNLAHQGHSKPNPSFFPNKFLQSSEIIWVT